jgi:hypothetical protein
MARQVSIVGLGGEAVPLGDQFALAWCDASIFESELRMLSVFSFGRMSEVCGRLCGFSRYRCIPGGCR